MSGAVDEFTKWLVGQGVVGVIAALIFMFYRKDVKQYTDLWKGATEQFMTIVKENTTSNVKLIGMLETQERNSMRKQDIEFLIDKQMRERLVELSWPRADEKDK